jgi:hypothetical protein
MESAADLAVVNTVGGMAFLGFTEDSGPVVTCLRPGL